DGEVTTPGRRRGSRPDGIPVQPEGAVPPVVTGEPGPRLAPTSPEETRMWARRTAPSSPPEASGPQSRRRWWRLAAAAVGAVAVIGSVVGLVAGSSGPKVTPRTPRLQSPSAALAAQLAPRQVEITSEQPTAVTIHWVDPSNGRYPFVVKVSDGSVVTATSST